MINCAKCNVHISLVTDKLSTSKYLCLECGKSVQSGDEYRLVWRPIVPHDEKCVICLDFKTCKYYNTFTDDFMCQGCYEK